MGTSATGAAIPYPLFAHYLSISGRRGGQGTTIKEREGDGTCLSSHNQTSPSLLALVNSYTSFKTLLSCHHLPQSVFLTSLLPGSILSLSQISHLVFGYLGLVPVKVRTNSTSSHHSTQTAHSRYTVSVQEAILFPYPVPCHTHLLPVMVMPVDTHWKMPTPGTKFSVMTGTRTSLTFILGEDRHAQPQELSPQPTPPPPCWEALGKPIPCHRDKPIL
jgi:hypothetical protein